MDTTRNGMTSREVLAVARLRLWARDRDNARNGRIADYTNVGRSKAQTVTSRYDAAIVRAIDFETAIGALPIDAQLALILTYRDGEKAVRVAAALQCSLRRVGYLLPVARLRLADRLEALDLL